MQSASNHTIRKEDGKYVIRRKADGLVSFRFIDLRLAMLCYERLNASLELVDQLVMRVLHNAIRTKGLTKYKGTKYDLIEDEDDNTELELSGAA